MKSPRFRPDIEGLRAVAVAAVLLFHAGVPHLAGGFVGVDVFFVISGFLIGGLLLAELESTGRVSLRKFYARRARRILPGAALVIVVVAVVSWLVLPPLRVVDVAHDALASAAYVVNWHFVGTETNYLAAGREASPLLHYWSLSVEEQFYLLWPALLIGAGWFARRTGRGVRGVRTMVAVVTVLVAAGSFAVSLVWTHSTGPLAYMGTPARAWQFALGAGLALLVRHGRSLPFPLPALVGWAGVAAIGWSVVTVAGTTNWPGTGALVPTLGAVAVIAAGMGTPGSGRFGPGRALATRPMRYAGRLSYSLYLWHWPVLVLVQAVTGPLTWPVRLAVVAASAIPAAAGLRLLETPIRFSPVVTARPGRGLSVGLTATVLPVCMALLLGATALHTLTNTPVAAAAPRTGLRLSGPDLSADPFESSGSDRTGGPTRPSPGRARTDNQHYPRRCILAPKEITEPPCLLGPADADGRVVLIGDSHAGQWYGAVAAIAAEHHWAVEVYNKSGCPLPTISVSSPQLGQTFHECDTWRDHALKRLRQGPRPKLVFLATLNRYTTDRDRLLRGWARTLKPLRALDMPLVYLRDTPFPAEDVPSCVSGTLDRWDRCAFPRADALRPDPLAEAIRAGRQPGVHLVDVNNFLCPPGPKCPVVRGTTLLYRDGSHLTNTAVNALAPAVDAQLEAQRVLPARPAKLSAGVRQSGPVTPGPAQAREDWGERSEKCLAGPSVRTATGCWYGAQRFRYTVVLLGDSHAFEWVPTLDIIARAHRWRLLVLTKQGCPAAMLHGVRNPKTGRAYDACDVWRRSAFRRMHEVRPDAVVLAQLGRYATAPDVLKTAWAPTLDAIKVLGVPMVYLRDTPYPGKDIPTCVSAHLDDWDACAFGASKAVLPDPAANLLRAGWYPRTTVVDLNGALCPGGRCPAVWDGTLAYLDHSHLTATFARQLAPALASAMRTSPLLQPLLAAP
ncbi:Peptidoglycan/LPS O-acetylase OafA/YrhL, contains acyltransferase and SGNH-hydrolase domains [Actinopolymorpha cephalotaxi]|uniref:Peptidoglycan/LPS O-acetylase OafA/YrhL n=1 Tax=Actinopolymorpha cephalotaxi TaxID=504797 RepID=A0A1I2LKN2_9ACTN|nr:acyltransferase family protein [Actinopolymorpha cephalotaxi]NYH84925.1 peptidoglycan/LPS O-acetylase OafA/YrhL [Actinopolymorpha cephalotaxi]SFF77651.1 Peptidoglycan/LPS O-acetylase OafA/YrhL, contains acyltransferase and SGNH-hydrolase domains [Actinopolymorpha cephalotaxi]